MNGIDLDTEIERKITKNTKRVYRPTHTAHSTESATPTPIAAAKGGTLLPKLARCGLTRGGNPPGFYTGCVSFCTASRRSTGIDGRRIW